MDPDEARLQTDALRRIANELEALNEHVRVYLTFMALNILAGPCAPGGPSDMVVRAAQDVLAHTQKP